MWLSLLAAAVVGFVVGVMGMVCLGHDPLFRTALAFTKKCSSLLRLSSQCIQRQHDQEWRTVATLSRCIAAKPLTVDEWTQLHATVSTTNGRSSATVSLPDISSDDSIDAMAGPTKLLLLHREVAHLMGCLCQPKDMQRLERALQGATQSENSKSAMVELADAFVKLGKTPRAIIQAIKAIVTTQHLPTQSAVDFAVQVTSSLFSPSLYMSVSAFHHLVHPRHHMFHLMLQHTKVVGESAVEESHRVTEYPSLMTASAPLTTPTIDISWLNVVLHRWFDEFATNTELLEILRWKVNRIVQSKLLDVKAIDSIEVTNPVLGIHPPEVSNLCVHPTLHPSELCMSANVEYTGNGSIDVMTRVTLSNLMQHQTTLSLRVHVASLHGRARLFVPQPGCDPGFGWVAFDEAPKVQLTVESCPPHVEPLPQLGALLTQELEEKMAMHMVLPVWTRVSLPWDISVPLESVFSAISRRSTKSEGSPNLAAAAGGFMGEVMGGAVGGRFGGHVARGVGEAVGGHLAKYATERIVPIVHEVMASAKSMAHPRDRHVGTSQSVDDLVHLAKLGNHNVVGEQTIESALSKAEVQGTTPDTNENTAKPIVSPKSGGVDVARLVSLAKAKKAN
ncbi:hypothetical protein H257_10882 [Aphanomyces astaci]|uniref:SMP-LTD domain-containing protein n=1 Tax=Aphanomyces astaci TaxID=112090 RepID=W4G6A4_APHAT|nr:hypothetical protein H257_10882 [Aphanomyces astaci]ETV74821.1 hypothetical protein H257_10882 [Aphanomyces astaci]|eukprot:XP_009835908.1 hypothetical protein H257_10882 [Aphanomyces astaci]